MKNHISRSEEIPEVVALPAGSYTISGRSENEGCVRVPIVIRAGELTVLDLELAEEETPGRVAHN